MFNKKIYGFRLVDLLYNKFIITTNIDLFKNYIDKSYIDKINLSLQFFTL